jgi:14-3-3 protein epsilon
MGTRDESVFMARLAESAERFDDMMVYMRKVAAMGAELTPEERNLLSTAYKNSVGSRRQAWRAITQLEEKEEHKGPANLELIGNYRKKVEAELTNNCTDIINVLKDHSIPTASTEGGVKSQGRVFLLKLKADYHRYLAEFASSEDHSKHAQDAHDSYKASSDIALAELPPTDPVRLGLALNFSVFYYEVFMSPEKACVLAKSAFDDAINMMDSLDEDDYKDSATIMQLLRDNLQLWTADMHVTAPQDTDNMMPIEEM